MLLEPAAPHSTSPMPPPDPQPPLPPERSPAAEPSSAPQGPSAPSPPGERQGALFEVDVPPWEQDVEQGICAGVVFSEPPFGPFHYRVPPPLIETVQPGMRLRVPLGRGNRSVVGWCVEVTETVRGGRSFKDVAAVLDAAPLCSAAMVQLVLWMSDYYQAAPGQVFDALIPSGVRAAAGTRERTYLTPSREALDDRVIDALPTKQRSVLRHLIAAARPLTVGQLATLAETTDETVRRLRRRGLLRAEVRREMEIDPLAGGLSQATGWS